MTNEKWFQDILQSLEKIDSPYWKPFPKTPISFSRLYNVALGGEAQDTIPYIFGESRIGRWKNHIKNLRNFQSLSFEAPVPTDSVIFVQSSRQRLIIVSRKENLALKISVSKGQLALLDFEVKLMSFLNTTDFSPFTYSLLDHGENWTITSFAANRDSLTNHRSPEKFLLEHINKFMKPMSKFYRAYGIEKIAIEQWLINARQRGIGHPNQDLILKMIFTVEKNLEKIPSFDLPKVQLHFDLHSKNILMDRDDIKFIDWEVTIKGLCLVDYFDFFRRVLKKDKQELKTFTTYLQNNSELSSSMWSRFLQDLKEWHASLGFLVPEGSESLIPFLYSLERTLIYYERWQEDRLSDKKGIEYLISTCS